MSCAAAAETRPLRACLDEDVCHAGSAYAPASSSSRIVDSLSLLQARPSGVRFCPPTRPKVFGSASAGFPKRKAMALLSSVVAPPPQQAQSTGSVCPSLPDTLLLAEAHHAHVAVAPVTPVGRKKMVSEAA